MPIVHSCRCWVVVHYIDLSVYLLLDGHSECLQFLSITEKAVMNIMYKSLNRYVKLLGEQNGYIKRWVCICLLRNYQTISQSVCVILYSHQPFLQRWTLQRPVCEYVRIWVREGNWIQYFQLNLPVSSIALHLDLYCASLILNSQMFGFNFSRKQVTS